MKRKRITSVEMVNSTRSEVSKSCMVLHKGSKQRFIGFPTIEEALKAITK